MKARLSYFGLGALCAFAFVGCATMGGGSEAAYKKTLNSWLGHTEEELEARWGVPQDSQPAANGGTELFYISNDTERSGWHGLATTGVVCHTQFYVTADDKIYSWAYQSNSFGGNYRCGWHP